MKGVSFFPRPMGVARSACTPAGNAAISGRFPLGNGLIPLQQTILQISVQKLVLGNVARRLIQQHGDLKVLCLNEAGLKMGQLKLRNLGVLVINRLDVRQQILVSNSGSYPVSRRALPTSVCQVPLRLFNTPSQKKELKSQIINTATEN